MLQNKRGQFDDINWGFFIIFFVIYAIITFKITGRMKAGILVKIISLGLGAVICALMTKSRD